MLKVVAAKQDELPPETTHGFFVIFGEGEMDRMFFHWHNQPVEEQLLHIYGEGDEVPDGVDPAATTLRTRVSYADVLTVLPDRLEAMGYGDEAAEVLGEVVGRFGAG